MGLCLRANLEIRANAVNRWVFPPFTGETTGTGWDFGGCTATMTWGRVAADPSPPLILTTLPGPNGRLFLNYRGVPGVVALHLTAAGASMLFAGGPLLLHLCKVVDAFGSPTPLIAGASVIVPG